MDDILSKMNQAWAPMRVLGRYALYEEIAMGGMASVHYGRLLGPVGFARTVAIKRLHERLARDPEFTEMFLDEARLAARIRHPNVVPTLDVIAMEEELFLVMDYVQGESLSRLFARLRELGSRIPIPMLTTIVVGALHGLHAAHEARDESGAPLGLIHRDVSPQNIMVGVDGVARVLDFGVAKAAGRATTTRDGELKGKLAYMAPEQLRGKPLTRAVDVHAVGLVLWEGLVGRRLYKAESEGELVTLVLEAKFEPPSAHVAGIPPDLDAVVLRALSREPAERFATAREMARALERLMPPVPASEIGEWVEQIAQPALAARNATIASIERASTSGATGIPDSRSPSSPLAPSSSGILEPAPDTSVTNASAVEVPMGGARGKQLYATLGLALVLGFVVFGTIGSFGLWPYARSTPPAASVTLAAPSAAPEEASQATWPPSAVAAPSPLFADGGPKTAPAEDKRRRDQDEPIAAPTRTTTSRPKAAPRPTPTARSKPGCDPPYVIDANGTRRYKRECAR